MCCIPIRPWDECCSLITTFFFNIDEIIYFSSMNSTFCLWRGLAMKSSSLLDLPSPLIMFHSQLKATSYWIQSEVHRSASTVSSSQHPLTGYLVLNPHRIVLTWDVHPRTALFSILTLHMAAIHNLCLLRIACMVWAYGRPFRNS
jgi:hypothetical protein